ncbi:MAG: Asp-tRNA(Asn)/Glu-tRNA(Gln) amidotransferase subunit GatC [Planctomycetes bacterium]|nr:Asp-tRNA(Asn)/Glu-tRNA(Gln) amidotransferase subunit GatC [Planctomycetota bacterium]
MDESPLETLRRTAALARLRLDDAEAQGLSRDVAAILAHFQALAALDVAGVVPTLGGTPLEDVKRADEPRPCMRRDALLANAPDPRDAFLGVPKTLETDA